MQIRTVQNKIKNNCRTKLKEQETYKGTWQIKIYEIFE